MAALRFALYLTYLFLGRIALTTNLESPIYVRQDSGFLSANVGENVTMRCFYQGDAMMFYWYKQTLGQNPRLVSTHYKHEISGTFLNEFKNNSRFSLETGNGNYHLIISNLHISDSATYYCAGCYAYDLEFAEGVTVSVEGSGLKIPASVHQSASESIQPGRSETLNCTVHTGTCDGEHSVYWFKTSKESHPGLIYTHGVSNDQCERKPNNQTHTCVYNLPMQSLNLSHAGTYCAVASCGHILFGEDKKLDVKHKVHSLVYFLTGALAFTTTLVVLLAYAAYTMNNRTSCQCKDSRSSAASTPNAADSSDSDNLHYAALKAHKVNRSTRLRNDVQSECVYSGVRQ
uniref:Novel immune-type receptor 3 n=1 Tax=Dicentrarchus labrax TaxID=13489 RepID=D2WLB5_DICLA|nr:novel immune-type receptor 3 [Dicentrarchus labrax]